MINGKGQELWQRAITVIPGGNGLLSKRPDRYAPDIWPSYFSEASGVDVYDLEGHRYVDMAQMGMGTAILGYSDKDVNKAVKEAIDSGINTTLNTPEEVYLAEYLLSLNPFAGQVRFARSGGEAMAIAVRIARASTGRDKVAFSGYHGWCDWYLATNLSGRDGLKEHLLPGLSPRGVPKGLKGSILPFKYNDVQDFIDLIEKNPDVGTVVFEGARYDYPTPEFLEAIQEVATKNQLVVILDEITSGWRITDGGVYKTNGFTPDICVYGKAMGNGFAISAIVGKNQVMDAAQDTFMSSTFWTERVGFVAALATLKKLTENRVWEHLGSIGTEIGEGWLNLAEKHGLKVTITDFKPLISLKFQYKELNPAIATLFTQEMLRRSYLAATSVYVSYSHSSEIVSEYLAAVDEVFAVLGQAISQGDVMARLETRVKDEGFRRLT